MPVPEMLSIKVETGQKLEAHVLTYREDAIWIMVGKGNEQLRCKLVPTRNRLAYFGSIMGREIVYARSVQQVRDDLSLSGANGKRKV